MVQLLNDFPPYVLAYKASGTVGKEEYERIVMSKADEVVNNFGALNFIVRLETGMENYSVAALIDYLKISFKHIHRWNRMAIVSDQKTVRQFYDALSPLVPGKIIGFELKDFAAAKQWVSTPALIDENWVNRNWRSGLLSGAIATGAMTVFSYVISKMAKKNFNEPVLLGQVIQGNSPNVPSQTLGWVGHFGIGSVWSMIYVALQNQKKELSFPFKFWMLSGSTAILIWRQLFRNNPRPTPTHRRQFYGQLFFAHLVFTYTLHGTYSFLNRKKF